MKIETDLKIYSCLMRAAWAPPLDAKTWERGWEDQTPHKRCHCWKATSSSKGNSHQLFWMSVYFLTLLDLKLTKVIFFHATVIEFAGEQHRSDVTIYIFLVSWLVYKKELLEMYSSMAGDLATRQVHQSSPIIHVQLEQFSRLSWWALAVCHVQKT
jgi:hypothetical protein